MNVYVDEMGIVFSFSPLINGRHNTYKTIVQMIRFGKLWRIPLTIYVLQLSDSRSILTLDIAN